MPDLQYANITEAIFVERPNRFVAKVILNGAIEAVHVKNTGRCREILIPGTKVFLEKSFNPKRKMEYSLVAVYKGDCLINIDSQAPNKVVRQALKKHKIKEFSEINLLQPEVTYSGSRFDFYYESPDRKGFIEVKGVTLEQDGIALFPDAPTQRGSRHLQELIVATQAGFQCAVIFLVQLSGVSCFRPNRETDREFARAVEAAIMGGVRVLAYECRVTPKTLNLTKAIPVLI